MKILFISIVVLAIFSSNFARADVTMEDPIRDLYDAGKVQEARGLLIKEVNQFREDIKQYKPLLNVTDAEYYRTMVHGIAQQIIEAMRFEVKIAKENPTPDDVLSLSLSICTYQ